MGGQANAEPAAGLSSPPTHGCGDCKRTTHATVPCEDCDLTSRSLAGHLELGHYPTPRGRRPMADADDGMDRATIERNLAQVERDMHAASEDIAHQRET